MKTTPDIVNSPSFLVGILYSGEAELDDCIRSVEGQIGIRIHYFVLKDLKNVEAHKQLYQRFEDLSLSYDYFAKVDADMVLQRKDALFQVSKIFDSHPGIDHVCSTVQDWSSGSNIYGVHFFSNRAKWPNIDNALMPDPNPIIPGERILLSKDPAPLAYHMPNPNTTQCLLFGFHRALKILQRATPKKQWTVADQQYTLLDAVCREYHLNGDKRRLAVLAGAVFAFQSENKFLSDKAGNEELKRHLNDYFCKIECNPEVALLYFRSKNIKRIAIKFSSIFVPRWKEIISRKMRAPVN